LGRPLFDSLQYPKIHTLHGDTQVSVVPLAKVEHSAVVSFINRLPSDERIYLWDDLTDPVIYKRWSSETFPLIVALAAISDDKVITVWTLTQGDHSWTRHIGSVWGIVEPSWRNRGIAALMVRELLLFAGQVDIERVVIELVKPQKGPLGHFSKVGFEIAATLKGWTKDSSGRYQDLVILTMKLEPAWRKMEVLLSRYDSISGW